MSLLSQRLLSYSLKNKGLNILKVQVPAVEQNRFNHRAPNLRKPISHWRRDLVKAVTKPKYVKRYNILPIDELCTKALIHREKLATEGNVHPYFRILADEIFENIEAAKLVAIFHKYPYQKDDFHDMRLDLHKIQMSHLYHTMRTIKLALQGTEYEPLTKLYEAQSLTFISQEAKFSRLLKMIKKYPFAILIGGVYEGRIISPTDFQNLASNPFIESYQGQLSGLLASSGQRLISNLSRHQQELCSSLQRYIDDQTEKTPTEE